MKVYEEKRVSPDSTFKVVDRVPKKFLKAKLLQLLMTSPSKLKADKMLVSQQAENRQMLVSQQAENRQMLVLGPF